MELTDRQKRILACVDWFAKDTAGGAPSLEYLATWCGAPEDDVADDVRALWNAGKLGLYAHWFILSGGAPAYSPEMMLEPLPDGLTPRQIEIVEFAERYEIEVGDVAPREVIADRFGVSVETIARELKTIRDAGALSEGMYKMRPGDPLTPNEERQLDRWWRESDYVRKVLSREGIAAKWGVTPGQAKAIIRRFVLAGCVRMAPRYGRPGAFRPSKGGWYILQKNPLNPNEYRTLNNYEGLGESKRCVTKKKPKPTPPAESNPL